MNATWLSRTWRFAALAASTALIVACSSAATTAPTAAPATAAPATAAPATAPPASAAPASMAPASAAGGTDFAALVAQYEKGYPPQFMGPTAPAPAPKTFTLGVIPCSASLSGCENPARSALDAAKALGWQGTEYDGGGNPRQQNTMILNALSAGANGIITVSVDATLIQQGWQAAKTAGVPVVSISSGTGTPNPHVDLGAKLDYAVDVSMDYPAAGAAAADWMIADSGGTGHIVLTDDPEFHSNVITLVGLQAELKKCTGCTVDPTIFNFNNSEVGSGQLATRTVAYFNTHPDMVYMWSSYDPAAAVQVPALDQAGLGSKVKMVSIVAAAQNLALIQKGDVQYVDIAQGNDYLGWAGVDQLIRAVDKLPFAEPNGETSPYALLVKTNIPASGVWTTPFDYKTPFLKLWTGK